MMNTKRKIENRKAVMTSRIDSKTEALLTERALPVGDSLPKKQTADDLQ
jgi:hypothetical protein